MVDKTRAYIDLDVNFKSHPLYGDVSRKFDEESISQSLRLLIHYNSFDIKFNDDIKGTIREYLFEHASPLVAIAIRKTIQDLIDNHEPRVKVIVITVVPVDQDGYDITIEYKPLNDINPVKVSIFLKRLR